jgi:hypothetical protein
MFTTRAELLVIDQARQLVAKIRAEEARGTPLHPAGHPDCPWTVADGGYPAEYVELVETLEQLDAEEKAWGCREQVIPGREEASAA